MAFYSEDILNVKDGKFGKIWMASHKMTKLTRREVASVNVSQSCKDVMEYIETRHGEKHGRQRKYPRLSLYLSSYLMYGATIIYNKQCEYLLMDVESIFISVGHLPTLTDDKTIRRETAVTNAEYDLEFEMDYDYYTVMEEAERLQQKLPPAETWTLGYTHLRSPLRSSCKSKSRTRKSKAPEVPVVRREDITLPEREELPSRIDPVMSPQLSKDDDFQSRRGHTLELEEMPVNPTNLMSASTPRQPPEDTTGRSSRTSKKSKQTTLESLTRPQQSVMEKTPTLMPPPEEIPVAQAAPSEILNITVPVSVEEQQEQQARPHRKPAKRSLHLDQLVRPASPEEVPKHRRKKQNRKIVTDKVTQIPKLQIRKNIEKGIETLQPFVIPENTDNLAVTDLMKVPGRTELRRQPFSMVWSRGAVFRRNIPDEDLPTIESPESGRSSERTEEATMPDMSAIQPPEQPSREQTMFAEEEMLLATRIPEDMLHLEPRTAEESIEILRQTSASMENLDISAIELSSMERARGADASGLADPQALNVSDIPPAPDSSQKTKGSASKRKSRSVSSRKSADGSLELEQAPSYTSLHSMHTSNTSGMDTRGLYNIEEEMIVIPVHTQLGGEEHAHEEEALLRSIEDELSSSVDKHTTFRKLCPPEHFTRQEAVSHFTALIGLCTKRSIKAYQKICFGDIYIVME